MLKSIVSTSGFNLVTMLILFIQGIITSRLLGAEGKGELALYLNIFNLMLVLFSLGIRQVSSYYASKKKQPIKDVFEIQNSFVLIAFTILSVMFLFIPEVLSSVIDESAFLNYTMIFFGLIIAIYVNYRSFISLSLKKIYIISYIKIVLVFVPTLLFPILGYFIGYTVSLFIELVLFSHLVTFIYINKEIRVNGFVNSIEVKGDWINIKKYFISGVKYAIPLFIFGLNFKVDQFMLAEMTDLRNVGVYSVGASFAELVWQIPSVLTLVFFSYGVNAENSKLFSRNIIKKTRKIMMILFPVLVVYLVLCSYFVPILYGDEFIDAVNVIILLMPGIYCVIAFNLLNADAASRGKPHLSIMPFSISLVVNIIINLFAIPKLGIMGAALASTISYTVGTIIYVCVYVYDFKNNQLEGIR